MELTLKYPSRLISATFLARPNRFLAEVLVEGSQTLVHVPDPGRLKELLLPSAEVYLRPAAGPRKTKFDLVLVKKDETLISLDSILPNRLVARALEAGFFSELVRYPIIQREMQYGASRLDFCLTGPEEKCLLEVKSVTLVQNKLALFPDAPTQRGARHLRELSKARAEGMRAIVLFIIQRSDAAAFSPHKKMDPVFTETLKQAYVSGVEIWAYKCSLTLQAITLGSPVPVVL
jgi:sugar fermentation stimulation protein A